jgi:acetyl/propionyl-CoA carboxylase alpha subunit
MVFEVEVNGRTRAIAVERVGGTASRYRVSYDGRTVMVDAVRVEADTLSLIFPEDGHASHEIGFAAGLLPGELSVYLHAGTVTATVNGRRSRRAATVARATGAQRIVAPMPGKVLRVLVAAGEEVAARQPLVVVEAMKMENELSCPRPGRVREVAVTVGQSVEAGRLLVVVE